MMLLLIVLASVWSVSSQHVRYVLPDGSSPLNCPAQPCLTLDQYTQHTEAYFTTGATFLFLAGNHSLQAAVNLRHTSDVTLRGEGNDSQVNIIKYGSTIRCFKVTNLTIEKMTIIFPIIVHISSSDSIRISDCIFQGNEALYIPGRALLNLLNSTVQILNCVFDKLVSNIPAGSSIILALKANLTVVGSIMRNCAAISYGGIMEARYHSNVNVIGCDFVRNRATYSSGAIHTKRATITVSESNFIENAGEGGAILAENACTVTISGSTFIENRAKTLGGAICAQDSNLTVSESEFIGNQAARVDGGAISVENANLTLHAGNKFTRNKASNGGAIFIRSKTLVTNMIPHYSVTLSLKGDNFFCNNTASGNGGGLYAADVQVTLSDRVNFTSNTAQNGSVMFINAATSLTLNKHTTLTTSHNHASLYGGAIYHEDVPTSYECEYPDERINKNHSACFLRLGKYEDIHINSYFDSAGRDGSFLYGGLLDKCRLSVDGTYNYSVIPYNFLKEKILRVESHDRNKINAIASEPYRLCICGGPVCSNSKNISISRGQKFTLSVRVVAQGEASLRLTALTSINARLHFNQAIQIVHNYCTKLEYTLYSSLDQSHDKLNLTIRGTCANVVRAVVGVTLLPCPHPFIYNNEECACDKRLQEYPSVKCMTDEHNISYITKKHGTDFWMDILSDINGSYEGLILYKTCPPEYCKTETVRVSLDDLDSQCDDNRGGVLCGQCLDNYSLMLGSSKCRQCSHQHLALLLPFAVAGVALVVFLSFLRLTVATGMINSVILYANILQANRNTIFPVNAKNVLTVFIAWMNLDLGFETCFYDGMTAYAQTWLQFAFPLYVWLLISFIILSSRYSITVSKLIGHNPIAVLATLLLMSYTKLLKIIIEVYSSVDLDYPDHQTVTVWLKDANMPYLQSWHLLLTVVTTLVLVLFFLPYIHLLLLGCKLYRFSGRKSFQWFHRIRPLLESYYAPYNIPTRYWTGFLLLVRCALYITFSIYSLRNTNKSLLAIILTFIGLLAWLLMISLCLFHQIYKEFHNNVIEISVYVNLIAISAATIVGANTPALVYSLVGLVFVTMLGIIVYHFHLLYIAKSQVWQQFRVKVSTHSATRTAADKSSHNPHKIVHSETALREPLL